MKEFLIAAGSITGTDHKRPLNTTNCQDSYYYAVEDEKIVAVITDGCGAFRHSEVGAKLGARIIVKRLMQNYSWDQAWARIVSDLGMIAGTLETGQYSWSEAVENFLLFTIVGVMITPKRTFIFTRGDGAVCVNNNTTVFSQNNTPDYLGYHLINSTREQTPVIRDSFSTNDIVNIALATDGAQSQLADVRNTLFRNRLTWTNPDYVRRHLVLQQKANPTLLYDDATLLLIQRALI